METNKKNTIYLFSPPNSTNDFVGGLNNVKKYPISVSNLTADLVCQLGQNSFKIVRVN